MGSMGWRMRMLARVTKVLCWWYFTAYWWPTSIVWHTQPNHTACAAQSTRSVQYASRVPWQSYRSQYSFNETSCEYAFKWQSATFFVLSIPLHFIWNWDSKLFGLNQQRRKKRGCVWPDSIRIFRILKQCTREIWIVDCWVFDTLRAHERQSKQLAETSLLQYSDCSLFTWRTIYSFVSVSLEILQSQLIHFNVFVSFLFFLFRLFYVQIEMHAWSSSLTPYYSTNKDHFPYISTPSEWETNSFMQFVAKMMISIMSRLNTCPLRLFGRFFRASFNVYTRILCAVQPQTNNKSVILRRPQQ